MNPPHFIRSGKVPAGSLPPTIAATARQLGQAVPGRPPVLPVPPGALVVRGYGDSSSGYGRLVAHLMRGLESLGQPTAFAPISVEESRVPLDPFLRSRLAGVAPDAPSLSVCSPGGDASGSVLFTMWESSRLPAARVASANTARAVVVPCRWNAEVFRDSGVTVPIRVAPLAVDGRWYRPGPAEGPGGFVALAVARLAHGGARKGIEETVAAFLEALGEEPDARLVLKLWPDCRFDDPGHPRIAVDRTGHDDAGMRRLYLESSVYFSMSKGEGWGLPPMEAMGCGRPLVGPLHSGLADFATGETGWPVAFDPAPAGGFYAGEGDWFVPRHDSAVAQLRAAHADRGERARRGEAAARRAAEFTWSRSAVAVLQVLEEFGVTARRPSPSPAARVGRCPHRGSILPLSRQHQGCGCGGKELTECRAGRGQVPGRVTTADCLECVATGPTSPASPAAAP